MEKIILFGTGKMLTKITDVIGRMDEAYFDITEIWDNDISKQGSTILINGVKYNIMAPHNDIGENVIIITTQKYEREIREQLTNKLQIDDRKVKTCAYYLHYIKEEILERYNENEDEDIQDILKYLKTNELSVFNRKYTKQKYIESEFGKIGRDDKNGLMYAYWYGKKMYFKRSIDTKEAVKKYLLGIKREQIEDSPHCYKKKDYEEKYGDVIIDGGAAEGFFALERVENAKKIYIVEGDKGWVEALKYTFEPYSEKVSIIPKWIGEKDNDNFVSIDSINHENNVSLIKLDIEGGELNALKGAKRTLAHSDNVRIVACTYHKSEDAEQLSQILLNNNFLVKFSKGYMFFPYGETIVPELRRGLIFGKKPLKKPQIYIWGTGKWADMLYDSLYISECVIKGLIDIDKNKQGKLWKDKYIINSPHVLKEQQYDYVVVAIKNDKSAIRMLNEINVDDNRVITMEKLNRNYSFLDFKLFQTNLSLYKTEQESMKYRLRLENAPYEWGIRKSPTIRPAEELLENILENHNSLCRFGDGEWELMRGIRRPWFQNVNKHLQNKLNEVWYSNLTNLYIAAADNFGNLDKYTEDAADGIRRYLSGRTRESVIGLFENRIYYDAYVSRPYIIYRDGKYCEKIFNLFKRIWNGRDVVIVEGEYTRNGVRNDLLKNTHSVKRILCPFSNAFDRYSEILETAKKYTTKDTLVLITIGPTATVLAYDLANMGRWALDIGQLDNEYEWYLMHTKQRMEIIGKGVAELNGSYVPQKIMDEQYESEIVARIGI